MKWEVDPRKPIHEYVNKLGQSPIHVAIRRSTESGILYDVQEALDRQGKMIAYEKHGMDGMTALHLTVAVENTDYVKEILERSSNLVIGSRDIWGRDALHIAAKLGTSPLHGSS